MWWLPGTVGGEPRQGRGVTTGAYVPDPTILTDPQLVEREVRAVAGMDCHRPTVVLDTCVLLADPEALHAFPGSAIVLPLTVIEELDAHKTRQDDLGHAARTVIRAIETLRVTAPDGTLRDAVALPGDATLRIEPNGLRHDLLEEWGLSAAKADNRILAAALGLVPYGPVKLVTTDCAFRIKAAQLGLETSDYVPSGVPAESVGAIATIDVSSSLIDQLFADHSVMVDAAAEVNEEISSLSMNQGAVLRAGSQSVLVRRTAHCLVKLPTDQSAWELRPRSKEQRFALDLLMDTDVPVVALGGRAGTGKTAVCLAAALEQCFEPAHKRYERLMILRPLVAVGRQDVGYLPGTLEEKLGVWFEAIVDCMVALSDGLSYREANEQLAMWAEQDLLTMESVTFLRGRSLQRTFVIVDECQNLEVTSVRTILTRLGEGSKAVLLGDTSQLDNPFVTSRTCGHAVATAALAGSELFGAVNLIQGERSAVADLAAARL